jgi:hypothetical protein
MQIRFENIQYLQIAYKILYISQRVQNISTCGALRLYMIVEFNVDTIGVDM